MKLLMLLPIGFLLSTAAAQAKSEQADPDKKICKYERDTASRIGRTVCKTRSEWNDRARLANSLMTDSPRYRASYDMSRPGR